MRDVGRDRAPHRQLPRPRLEPRHQIGRALRLREQPLDVRIAQRPPLARLVEAQRRRQRRRLDARERAALRCALRAVPAVRAERHRRRGRLPLASRERVVEQRPQRPLRARGQRHQVAQHRHRQRLQAVEQPHQHGRRRLGVGQRAVALRDLDPERGRERRQVELRRGRQQHRAKLVGVERGTVDRRAGLGEEREVERDVVAHDRPPADEDRELRRRARGRRRALDVGVADRGQQLDRRRNRPARPHERLEALDRARAVEAQRADLDDAVVGAVDAGRLEVDRDEFRTERSRHRAARRGAQGLAAAIASTQPGSKRAKCMPGPSLWLRRTASKRPACSSVSSISAEVTARSKPVA